MWSSHMHGLVFVTWEKYLSERFTSSILKEYRDALAGTPATVALASRVYDDDILLTGIATVSHITRVPLETLLREFGRYFITNGLTRHLCAYILSQVHSGRDLLLAMHDAHQQMSRLPEGLTPPLFQYSTQSQKPDELTLIYDSPRKLCPVLIGAIEGAAERYGEQVHVVEQTCMKRGDFVCRFDIRFFASSTARLVVPEQMQSQQAKQHFAQFILSLLPDHGGVFSLSVIQLVSDSVCKERLKSLRIPLRLSFTPHLLRRRWSYVCTYEKLSFTALNTFEHGFLVSRFQDRPLLSRERVLRICSGGAREPSLKNIVAS